MTTDSILSQRTHPRWQFPSKLIPIMATAVVLLIMYAGGSLRYDYFFGSYTFLNLLETITPLGMAAIGATFVILSGGIDLSVGSVVACTTIIVATLVNKGMHPALVWIIALGAGTLFGALMGVVIESSRLPPFLVTLAGMFVARGLGFVINESQPALSYAATTIQNGVTVKGPASYDMRHWYDFISDHMNINFGAHGSIKFEVIVWMMFLVIAMVVLHLTRFGRAIYALGDDEHSASLMGVRIPRVRISVYAIAGFCSAMAGVLQIFTTHAGNAGDRVGMELDAIAAVVIGGTLLTGGVGYVLGTAMGVLILGLITALLQFQNVQVEGLLPILTGILLLLFVLLQKGVSVMSALRQHDQTKIAHSKIHHAQKSAAPRQYLIRRLATV